MSARQFDSRNGIESSRQFDWRIKRERERERGSSTRGKGRERGRGSLTRGVGERESEAVRLAE